MDGGGFKHENAKIRAKGVDFCGGTVSTGYLRNFGHTSTKR